MFTRAQLHRRRSAFSESGHFVTVAVRNALLSDPHPAAVQRHLELTSHDLDLLGSTHEQ
jgi:hypothetical protein